MDDVRQDECTDARIVEMHVVRKRSGDGLQSSDARCGHAPAQDVEMPFVEIDGDDARSRLQRSDGRYAVRRADVGDRRG